MMITVEDSFGPNVASYMWCEREHTGQRPPNPLAPSIAPCVARFLLKHGADLNMENKEGKIPFQLVRESTRNDSQQDTTLSGELGKHNG